MTERVTMLLVLLVFVLLPVPGEGGSLQVGYDRAGGRLSIYAVDAQFRDLAAQVAAATGVEVKIDPAIAKTVSVSVREQPLEEGLRQMARQVDLNHMFYYRQGKKGVQVSGVTFHPRGSAARSSSAPSAPRAIEPVPNPDEAMEEPPDTGEEEEAVNESASDPLSSEEERYRARQERYNRLRELRPALLDGKLPPRSGMMRSRDDERERDPSASPDDLPPGDLEELSGEEDAGSAEGVEQ